MLSEDQHQADIITLFNTCAQREDQFHGLATPTISPQPPHHLKDLHNFGKRANHPFKGGYCICDVLQLPQTLTTSHGLHPHACPQSPTHRTYHICSANPTHIHTQPEQYLHVELQTLRQVLSLPPTYAPPTSTIPEKPAQTIKRAQAALLEQLHVLHGPSHEHLYRPWVTQIVARALSATQGRAKRRIRPQLHPDYRDHLRTLAKHGLLLATSDKGPGHQLAACHVLAHNLTTTYFNTSGRFQATTLTLHQLKQHHDTQLHLILHDGQHTHPPVLVEEQPPAAQCTIKDHKISTPDKVLPPHKIMPIRPVINWSRRGPYHAAKLLQGCLRLLLVMATTTDPHCDITTSTWATQQGIPSHLPPGQAFITCDVDKCFDSLDHCQAYSRLSFVIDLFYSKKAGAHIRVRPGTTYRAHWCQSGHDISNPLHFCQAKLKRLLWHLLSSDYCLGPLAIIFLSLLGTPMGMPASSTIVDLVCWTCERPQTIYILQLQPDLFYKRFQDDILTTIRLTLLPLIIAAFRAAGLDLTVTLPDSHGWLTYLDFQIKVDIGGKVTTRHYSRAHDLFPGDPTLPLPASAISAAALRGAVFNLALRTYNASSSFAAYAHTLTRTISQSRPRGAHTLEHATRATARILLATPQNRYGLTPLQIHSIKL